MIPEKTIEKGFQMIEAAALKGERAPTNISMDNPDGQLRPGITTALVKAGRIKVEVYAHNWRVIEIVKGPHAGLRTKAPTFGSGKPYRTLGT